MNARLSALGLAALVAATAACAGNGGRRLSSCSPCSPGPSGFSPSCGPTGPYAPARPPGLVGGVTDDNVRLPEYLAYVASYPHGDVPKLDLTDRRIVDVVGHDGLPLWDVDVVASTPTGPFQARTNAEGRFLLPSAALALTPGAPVALSVDGHGTWLSPGADEVRIPTLRRWAGNRVSLDVALVVDTTGSMADEVDRLRTTLVSVVRRVAEHPLRPNVRVGGVAYRDVGDAYVTRAFPFTADLGDVQRTLDGMRASGGGDGPEAVQEALTEAVHGLSWSGEGSVRILFLVGDAPPHFERGVPYTRTMRDAIARGITVVPIACSGMDDRGEFVWRQLAAVTLGEFLFVSYGGETEHHTGPYLENDLDSLMLRAVGRHLDALAASHGVSQPPLPAPPPALGPYDPQAQLVPPVAPDRVGFGRAPWDFGIPGWPR